MLRPLINLRKLVLLNISLNNSLLYSELLSSLLPTLQHLLSLVLDVVTDGTTTLDFLEIEPRSLPTTLESLDLRGCAALCPGTHTFDLPRLTKLIAFRDLSAEYRVRAQKLLIGDQCALVNTPAPVSILHVCFVGVCVCARL